MHIPQIIIHFPQCIMKVPQILLRPKKKIEMLYTSGASVNLDIIRQKNYSKLHECQENPWKHILKRYTE